MGELAANDCRGCGKPGVLELSSKSLSQFEVAREEFMSSSFATLFCKRASCPSSQSLLAYNRTLLGLHQTLEIEAHLAACDFCNAELQLLTRHYDSVDEDQVAEMPAQLRRLAESLLNRGAARVLPELEENQIC